MATQNIRQMMRDHDKEVEERRKNALLEEEEQKAKGEKILKEKKDKIIAFKLAGKEALKGKIFTRDVRPPKEIFLEQNTGEIKVETSSYVPIKQQIERFMDAGSTLQDIRAQTFDQGAIDENRDGFKDINIPVYPTKIEVIDIKKQTFKRMAESERNRKADLRKQEEVDRNNQGEPTQDKETGNNAPTPNDKIPVDGQSPGKEDNPIGK